MKTRPKFFHARLAAVASGFALAVGVTQALATVPIGFSCDCGPISLCKAAATRYATCGSAINSCSCCRLNGGIWQCKCCTSTFSCTEDHGGWHCNDAL